MKDRRSVDDLSIDELERVLAEKKRAARESRLDQFRQSGRAVRLPVGALPEDADRRRASKTRAAQPGSRLFDYFLLIVEVGPSWGWCTCCTTDRTCSLSSIAMSRPLSAGGAHVHRHAAGHRRRSALRPYPANSAGGSQPNDSEIPDSLLPLVQSLPAPVVPTQGPDQALRIVIPAINVDSQVVQGDGWEQLKKGVGQHLGTADPGRNGNMVLSAHDDIFGEIFRHLDKLQPGDEVQIYTASQIYTYVVTGTALVAPTDVSVMSATATLPLR